MIKSIIQAGFGNQLFQYAAGYALAKKLNCELAIDISFYGCSKNANADNRRLCNLNKLKIPSIKVIDRPRTFLKYRLGATLRLPLLRKLISMGENIIWEDVAKCREYQRDLFNNVNTNRHATLYGFWQNTMYFRSVLSDLKKQFMPNYRLPTSAEEYCSALKEHTNSVGVHIRRGDFVKLGWNKGEDYYTKAIGRIRQELSDPHFYIVTDDKAWTREHIPASGSVNIVDVKSETTDIDEFFILSQCRHHIISESTYGWWAAFLNSDTESLVIIPENAKGEIFEQNWIRM